MNHDATHCADYQKGKCPKHCYRAELTEEYRQRFYELHYLPVSWAHYIGTDQCERKQQKDMLFASIKVNPSSAWVLVGCFNYYCCRVQPVTDWFSTQQEAVEAWNRRTSDAS